MMSPHAPAARSFREKVRPPARPRRPQAFLVVETLEGRALLAGGFFSSFSNAVSSVVNTVSSATSAVGSYLNSHLTDLGNGLSEISIAATQLQNSNLVKSLSGLEQDVAVGLTKVNDAALSTFEGASSKIGALGTGVSLVGVGVSAWDLYNNITQNDTVGTGASAFGLGLSILGVANPLAAVASLVYGLGQTVGQPLLLKTTFGQNLVNGLADELLALPGQVRGAINAVEQAFEAGADATLAGLESVAEAADSAVAGLVQDVDETTNAVLEGAAAVLNAADNPATGVTAAAADAFLANEQAVLDSTVNAVDQILNQVDQNVSQVVDAMQAAYTQSADTLLAALGNIATNPGTNPPPSSGTSYAGTFTEVDPNGGPTYTSSVTASLTTTNGTFSGTVTIQNFPDYVGNQLVGSGSSGTATFTGTEDSQGNARGTYVLRANTAGSQGTQGDFTATVNASTHRVTIQLTDTSNNPVGVSFDLS